MNTFFNALRWLIGIILCLAGLFGFSNQKYVPAAISLSLGLLILPPITKNLFSIKERRKKKLIHTQIDSSEENTIEIEIDVDERQLNSTRKTDFLEGIKPRDIAGFSGNQNFSGNKEYAIIAKDYGNDENKGRLALIHQRNLLFSKQLERPKECKVTNDGVVICCDILNSPDLSGNFVVFDKEGFILFEKRTTANLGNCLISKDSKYAVFNTLGSDTDDANSIFIVDVFSGKMLNKFSSTLSLYLGSVDSENEILKLKDNNKLIVELDFFGNQLNKNEHEIQFMNRAPVVDKLYFFEEQDEVVRIQNPEYLELLNLAIKDEDASYSIGLDKIHRRIGEVYEYKEEFKLAVKHWETALDINPKVGVKRKLDALRKSL